MKKIFMSVALILLSACNVTSEVTDNTLEKVTDEDVNQFAVKNISAEVEEEVFVFRLASEKDTYQVGEEVKIAGELEYIGTEDKVTIVHSASPVLYTISEKVRGHTIGSVVNEIAIYTELDKGKPFVRNYSKSGGHHLGDVSNRYTEFVGDFMKGKGFPPGYYVVDAVADFYLHSDNQEENRKSIQIKASIDFKVLE